MAGFLDVLLRGLILVLASLALGGVVWVQLVLRVRPGAAPGPAAALALRVVAAAAGLTALAQSATLLVALVEVRDSGGWPLAAFAQTTFALTALTRIALGLAIVLLALRLAGRAAPVAAWRGLAVAAFALVAASAVLSHAVARVEDRALLLLLDAAHQIAAAVWIGGLAHLTIYAALRARETRPGAVGADVARGAGSGTSGHAGIVVASPASTGRDVGGLVQEVPGSDTSSHHVEDREVVRRFSNLAFGAVVVLIVAGVVLTWR
jgi:putative copper export protein